MQKIDISVHLKNILKYWRLLAYLAKDGAPSRWISFFSFPPDHTLDRLCICIIYVCVVVILCECMCAG